MGKQSTFKVVDRYCDLAQLKSFQNTHMHTHTHTKQKNNEILFLFITGETGLSVREGIEGI